MLIMWQDLRNLLPANTSAFLSLGLMLLVHMTLAMLITFSFPDPANPTPFEETGTDLSLVNTYRISAYIKAILEKNGQRAVKSDHRKPVVTIVAMERAYAYPTVAWLKLLERQKIDHATLIISGNDICEYSGLVAALEQFHMLSHAIKIYLTLTPSANICHKRIRSFPLGMHPPSVSSIKNQSFYTTARKFLGNFLGTKRSGRNPFLQWAEKHYNTTRCRPNEVCIAEGRGGKHYADILSSSFLTFCPVGRNTETHRMYEAAALGSVPVVEDSLTLGHCGYDTLRFVKKCRPPFYFVKHWQEAEKIMARERQLTNTQKKLRAHYIYVWNSMYERSVAQALVPE